MLYPPSCRTQFNISCPPLAVSYVSLDSEGSVQWMEQSVLTLCATEYEIVVNSGVQKYQAIRSGYGRFRLDQAVVPGYIAKPDGVIEELDTVILGGICFTSSYDGDLYPPFPNDTDSGEILLGNTTLSFCWNSPDNLTTSLLGDDREWRLWLDRLGEMFGDLEDRPETASYKGIYWNFDGHSGVSYQTGGNEFPSIVKAKGLREFMIGITASMNSAWSQERVTGSFINSETIFEISWAWAILPVALNVLGYIVLISVIRTSMRTNQGKLWKGSTLASLYHGLQEGCILSNVDTVEAMEKTAAMTLVKLKFVDKKDRMLLSK